MVDERGKNWVVYQGDSAWNQCLALLKIGVTEVVLPREALLSGTLPSTDSIVIHGVPIETVRLSADLQAIVWRQIRLRDCVHWLAREQTRGLKNGWMRWKRTLVSSAI